MKAPASTDLHAAIDAAFEQAKRRLKDYVSRRRGEVKAHHAKTDIEPASGRDVA